MEKVIEQLKRVRETGKIAFGFKKVEKEIINKKAKLIIISKKAPNHIRDRILYLAKISDIPIVELDITTNELGTFCGRPHRVSCCCVIDEGLSKILEVIK